MIIHESVKAVRMVAADYSKNKRNKVRYTAVTVVIAVFCACLYSLC